MKLLSRQVLKEISRLRGNDTTINTQTDGEITFLGFEIATGRAYCRVTGSKIPKGSKVAKLCHDFNNRCGSGFTATKMYVKCEQ